MTKEQIINFLQEAEIEKKDFIILSESAKCMKGLVGECNLLSILVNRKAMDVLKEKFQLILSSSGWCTLKLHDQKVNILFVEKFQKFEVLENSLYQVEMLNPLLELYFSKKPERTLAKNNVNTLFRL